MCVYYIGAVFLLGNLLWAGHFLVSFDWIWCYFPVRDEMMTFHIFVGTLIHLHVTLTDH